MTKHLIIMGGIPGSGKSTRAKELAAKYGDDCRYISRDEIRFHFLKDGDDYFKYENKVLDTYFYKISRSLKYNKYTIADATQCSEKAIAQFMWYLSRYNYHYDDDIIITYYWINTPVDECIRRNEQRDGLAKIPADAIRRFKKNMFNPYKHIGHDFNIVVEEN